MTRSRLAAISIPSPSLSKATLSKRDLLFGVVTGVLVLAFGYVYAQFVQDDAYITFRYARNLATGEGFVYNAGEHVLGTSTPLYTLTLALLAKVTALPIPKIGNALGLASLWTATFALYKLGSSGGRTFSAVTSLLFISSPFLRHMVGMEAFFLLAILLLAAWAYARERLWTTSILVGALVLTRYEMVLVGAILALTDWLRIHRRPIWLWPAAAIIGSWLTYATLYFGSPIPLSSIAKLVSARVPFVIGFLFYGSQFTKEVGWLAAQAFLLLVGIVALLLRRDIDRAYGRLLVWSVAYFLLAAIFAGSFPWYYSPLLPGIAIATAWGTRYLASYLPPPGAMRLRGRVDTVRRVTFLLLSGVLLMTNFAFWIKDWRAYAGEPFDHRFEAYREVSAWLRERMVEGETLAAGEIGYIGYFTNIEIVDLHGLVTPGVRPWLAKGLEFTTSQVIEHYSPTYLLLETGEASIDAYGLDSRYSFAASFDDAYSIYARTPGD